MRKVAKPGLTPPPDVRETAAVRRAIPTLITRAQLADMLHVSERQVRRLLATIPNLAPPRPRRAHTARARRGAPGVTNGDHPSPVDPTPPGVRLRFGLKALI
jgi:hypothetical protein